MLNRMRAWWDGLEARHRFAVAFGALVGAVVIFGVVTGGFEGAGGGSDPPDDEPSQPSDLTGEFVGWEAVDDARGWALFTVTNKGSSAVEATCAVSVFNDFGNFGVNIMAGERVGAGATISRRIAIDVDEGSFLINEGEVTDC